jgi:hypothetical protein
MLTYAIQSVHRHLNPLLTQSIKQPLSFDCKELSNGSDQLPSSVSYFHPIFATGSKLDLSSHRAYRLY